MAEHLISIEKAQSELLACSAFLAETITSGDGQAEALSRIVPIYINKNEVDLAAEMANTLDDPFYRDKLLTQVAEKCVELDDDEYAFQLIDAIEDTGAQSMARERVALQKSAKNETDRALEIIENLPHPDDAFADIALHQVIKGEEASALDTIARIDFPMAKVTAFQNIALHYLKNEERDRAVGFFEKATVAAGEIEYYEEKIRASLDNADYFIQLGEKGRAIKILDNAKIFAERIDGVHRDGIFARISLGFVRAGSMEFADQTLDLVGDKSQIASCLLGYSQIFFDAGDLDEALETLEEGYAILKSQRDNETRDSHARLKLLGAMAVQFARFSKPDRAIEIAHENIDEMEQFSALAQIAQVATLQGKDEIARQALSGILEDSTRMFALIGMSDAKEKSGLREEAVQILEEAATLCDTVPQISSRSEAINDFVRRFQMYEQTDKARGLLTENLRTIAEIRSGSSRSISLAELSTLFEDYGYSLNDEEKGILGSMVVAVGVL